VLFPGKKHAFPIAQHTGPPETPVKKPRHLQLTQMNAESAKGSGKGGHNLYNPTAHAATPHLRLRRSTPVARKNLATHTKSLF